ncbi:unnamed protein product, partial [Adineta steineri]
MATGSNITCFTCNKVETTFPCKGCSKEFCSVHLHEHEQKLNVELRDIIDHHYIYEQRTREQKTNPYNHPLIDDINKWEKNSVEIIHQKAKECKDMVIEYLSTFFDDIETKLKDLKEQIHQVQIENEFNENRLNYLKRQLILINRELNNPSTVSIEQDSKSFINEISIILSQ